MERRPQTVKIRILKKTVAEGRRVRPGQVIEVSPRTAVTLISYNQAVEATENFTTPPVKPEVQPERTETKEIKPLISVIIPVYNDSQYLNRCLESIKNQSYPNIEVIVVDDHSSFFPPEIKDFSLNIKILRLSEHKGASMARNIGEDIAEGELLFFCDVDVILQKDCLNIMYRKIVQTTCEWAYCNYMVGDEPHIYQPFNIDEIKRRNLCSTMSLIQRGVFPGFDVTLKRFQDWDLFLNMTFKGYKGVWINDILFHAEKRDGISKSVDKNKAERIIREKWNI